MEAKSAAPKRKALSKGEAKITLSMAALACFHGTARAIRPSLSMRLQTDPI